MLLPSLVLLLCVCDKSYAAYIFGWMLHNPIPDEMTLTLAGDPHNDTHTHTKCKEDADCGINSDLYCDHHYGHCDTIKKEGELCRRDAQCGTQLICIFGKCDTPSKPGHKGSRCIDDSDCKSNLCCARQHGEKICKSKLQRGHRCFVPSGGLDYSLNELCPCDEGLICAKSKSKQNNKRYFI